MPDQPAAGPQAGPRRYRDVAELLAGATDRAPFGSVPGKSGARLERVRIGTGRYVLKHVDLSQDWTLRASGCLAGVRTEPWWDRQLALCLLGALVQFGWEKALGGYDEELAWWEDRAVAAAALLN